MNYITKLQADNEALRAQLAAALEAINETRSYIASDKFRQDTTVQVQDIENRLRDAAMLAVA